MMLKLSFEKQTPAYSEKDKRAEAPSLCTLCRHDFCGNEKTKDRIMYKYLEMKLGNK